MNTYESTRIRFGSRSAAEKYHLKIINARRRKEREVGCILKALADIPEGGRVLDLPCGTGAISKALASAGYRVEGADSSRHMLAYAHKSVSGSRGGSGDFSFSCRDILDTGYSDNEFDAVVCNRLFHHYPDARIRKRAFLELARISRGPVIVSFFRDFTLSAVWNHHIRRLVLRKRPPTDRIPITLRELCSDARKAGLEASAVSRVRPGAMQTYVKFLSLKGSPGRPSSFPGWPSGMAPRCPV